ncbi:MAG: hypothetical protein AB7F79_02235 [Steroidobacteraceae bacterium]
MILIKSTYSVVFVAAFLMVSACSKQEQAEPAPAIAAAGMEAPAEGPPQMTPEERAAARAAQMEKSTATEFNMAPLIDPNTATREQLAAIAGLSEAGVQSVLDGRPFATQSALHAAIGAGLSDADRFKVYSAMFVKVNLNTADVADFELVPSTMAAKRLAREFEEYRPYKTMEDFSREMKKYVSEKEVAFLERFVTIN